MTRFARGKGTHQRVADDSTPWTDLKKTPPKRKNSRNHNNSNSSNQQQQNKKKNNSPKFGNKRRSEPENANFVPIGDPKVKGFGKTKTVKIFGNFWVGEEDARRLQSLAKKLKTEGVPRKDILQALQSERRKAEKAAKRRRDKTCFNCRQFGHVLADCPSSQGKKEDGEEVVETRGGEGEICFKCGSTEHSSRACKRKGEKFSFAKCFLCSKTGHIARQCPTNEKGIYPSGGSCDECGSVKHLKKDCPDAAVNQKGGAVDDEDVPAMERLADPFASSEYEAMDVDVPLEESAEQGESTQKPNSRKAFKNAQRGKKRKVDSEPEILAPAPVASSSSSSSVPKKRKIVKF